MAHSLIISWAVTTYLPLIQACFSAHDHDTQVSISLPFLPCHSSPQMPSSHSNIFQRLEEGSPSGRDYIYNYDWFVLAHSWDNHNIVKQLPSNLKKKKTKRKKNFFAHKVEAVTHLFPEPLPAHGSSMEMLFLISNSTQHLSLSWGNMVSSIHGYFPTVSLVPFTVLGVPPWDASSGWAHKRYATNLAHFSLKNKTLLSPNFSLSSLRNENDLEISSLGRFRLIWVVQVGKKCVFPKINKFPQPFLWKQFTNLWAQCISCPVSPSL